MTEKIIGSHEKAENGYSQNGFQGPSSDVPGKRTTSGFAPELDIAGTIKAAQADDLADAQDFCRADIPTTFGHKGADAGAKVPSGGRPVTTSAK